MRDPRNQICQPIISIGTRQLRCGACDVAPGNGPRKRVGPPEIPSQDVGARKRFMERVPGKGSWKANPERFHERVSKKGLINIQIMFQERNNHV